MDQQFVGIDTALHHVFPEPVGRRQQNGIGEPCFGVDAEHHPGAGQIRSHHPLHPDREVHRQRAKAMLLAVGDGPVGEQGGKAAFAGVQQRRFTLDVQEGVLLAGKAGFWEVFGCGAGAHGNGPLAQIAVSDSDRLLQVGRQLGREHQVSGLASGLLQGDEIVGVELKQKRLQARQQGVRGQEVAIGLGGGGKSARHPHALVP